MDDLFNSGDNYGSDLGDYNGGYDDTDFGEDSFDNSMSSHGGLSGNDSYNGGTPDELPNNPENFGVVSKKVTIIVSVIGILLIVVAFFIWGRLRVKNENVSVDTNTNSVSVVDNRSSDENNAGVQQNNVNTNENTNVVNGVQAGGTVATSGTQGVNTGEVSGSQVIGTRGTIENNLVEIDRNSIQGISDPISGYLTVVDIKTYARNSNDNSGNYIKSIVYGNITGMTGIYELTIPTESTSKIKVGDVIDVKYTTVSVGNKVFVVDIR